MQAEPITVHRRGEVTPPATDCGHPRWSADEVAALLELPLPDLLFRAQQVHREHFDPNEIQLSTLLSIKTGGCAENCGYCSQSAHHQERVLAEPMLDEAAVRAAAVAARVLRPPVCQAYAAGVSRGR